MKKYIILSLARSGSNNLVNLLNQHPKIANYGEILGEWTIPYQLHQKYGLGGKSVSGYLDYIYKSRLFFYLGQIYSAYSHLRRSKPINFKTRNQVELFGVKDFSSNFYRHNITSYLKERDDIQVISLYRANSLKRFISIEKLLTGGDVAVEKNQDSANEKKLKAIHLDIEKFMKGLEECDIQLQEHHALVNELSVERVLSIRYEDMFANHEALVATRDSIYEFLSVPPITIESGHKKILPDDLSKVVLNYDELVKTLKGTIYEQFLD
ncbi:MAG: hypothetical protein K9H64_11705 [Bacteroidales bacterium]|nr:hypothetical protein [Bacteroidales bacterium]MCF8456671.1 hypothetical protein [Bacteroidales bacterium]